MVCAGVGELSDAEDGLFGNPDVGRPGEGTVVLGRPIKLGFGDVKAEKNGNKSHVSLDGETEAQDVCMTCATGTKSENSRFKLERFSQHRRCLTWLRVGYPCILTRTQS